MLHRYQLHTRTTQRLTVSIDSDDRDVRFNVITRGILESRQLSAAGGVRCWSGKLPVAADNAIEVHATEKTCRYTLEVQIDNNCPAL